MKCFFCGISCFKTTLHRTNEFGKPGNFACKKCIKQKEPELFKNIVNDEHHEIIIRIEKIIL